MRQIAFAAPSGNRPSIYYGWWVLAASAFTEMLAVGSTSYAAGLFILPFEREFSLSRAAANSGLAIALAGGAFAAPLIGYLLDRFSARRVIAAGAMVLGLGFVTIATTSSLLLMVLTLLTAIPFGGMAMGPLATSTLTSRWFYRRRGRALGIAAVATSGGGILVVPLLSWAIERDGWRAALTIEALLIMAIVLVLAAFLIRNGPAELGLESHPELTGRPAHDVVVAKPGTGRDAAARSQYAAILSAPNFWTVGLVLATISGIDQAVVVTLVPYGQERAFSPSSTAFLISAFSVSAAVVKVSSGYLADYLEHRTIMLAATLCMSASLVLLLSFSDYPMLMLASCLAGAALGCALPTSAALVASCFGSPLFGRVMGLIYAGVVISSLIAVRFIGAIFDSTGAYHAAFLSFLVIAAGSALAAVLIRAPAKQNLSDAGIQAADLALTAPKNIVGNGSPR